MAAAFSAIMSVGEFVLPEVMVGMMEASATLMIAEKAAAMILEDARG